MKTKAVLLLSLLALAGATFAQNAAVSGISESTDQAKIADIERRAQELGDKPQATGDTGMVHHKMQQKHHHRHGHKMKEGTRAPKASDAAG